METLPLATVFWSVLVVAGVLAELVERRRAVPADDDQLVRSGPELHSARSSER